MTTHPGPVRPTATSTLTLRPVDDVTITGGLWDERRQTNRTISVPDAWARLHEAGNFGNVELAAGRATGGYTSDLPFLDSDLHKWLEAVGWVLGDDALPTDMRDELTARLAETTALLADAQADDGYLDSHFQVRFPGERFQQLMHGHELYCAGHLVQAAIAASRATGDTSLMDVARRFADLIVNSFGEADGKVDGVCGHPEIETALVELYRETGHRPYLDAASYFVERRGHSLTQREGRPSFGAAYFQDATPVRESTFVVGHSVRQLYLLAGVADLAAETGDAELLGVCERLWTQCVAQQTYLTGGVGAHHQDEAFGDPYELPNERSYCETCAAIASVMFSHRMLLATGEAKYADVVERTLYNGFLAGLSLDGKRYIYANPLQVRDGHQSSNGDQGYARVEWFRCACCPPNVMRLLASLPHYLAQTRGHELTISQYATGRITADLDAGRLVVDVETGYPWDGAVRVRVVEGPAAETTIKLRVPHWAHDAEMTENGDGVIGAPEQGWWPVTGHWSAGDEIDLTLVMPPRFTVADDRVDASRGQAAIERGPIVYCVEGVDHLDVRLDDIVVDVGAGIADGAVAAPLGGVPTVLGHGRVRGRASDDWWPYRRLPAIDAPLGEQVDLVAVPYFTWGNRGQGSMRVWLDRG